MERVLKLNRIYMVRKFQRSSNKKTRTRGGCLEQVPKKRLRISIQYCSFVPKIGGLQMKCMKKVFFIFLIKGPFELFEGSQKLFSAKIVLMCLSFHLEVIFKYARI